MEVWINPDFLQLRCPEMLVFSDYLQELTMADLYIFTQQFAAGRMAQFLKRLDFNLTDALTG